MQTKRRELFTTVRTEGAILPADLLQRIADRDSGLEGLKPEDFHRASERLNEVINGAWNRLLGQWQTFQTALAKLPEGDAATSVTRERWLLPLFRELDYGRLTTVPAIDVNGKSYPISHGWQKAPIHLVGSRVEMDRRSAGVAGAARTSPHSLLQELLNQSDDRLWGFVSNGQRLRILRNNISLTRQAFVEFDLEAMMDGEVYADFALLWLLCHQSRVEGDRPEQCWLEKWSRTAQETGTRALDTLRQGVEDAIKALGRGFLAYQANAALRQKLRDGGQQGGLDTQDYYRQILRLVYRLLFLFAAEDRGLLLLPSADEKTRKQFAHYYSTARLRHLAERHRGTRHCDLYHGLAVVNQKLGTPGGSPELGLPALGGFLWSDRAMPALADCRIANTDFLQAVRALAFTVDGNVLRAVDYKNLGAEELGSVYESLLELHPKINTEAATFELAVAAGHERKTTGSYYTPTSLITCLLDSALDPILEESAKKPTTQEAESAILALKVCDPACGSGHFLIAAAHRIAKRLAAVRTGDEEPAPDAYRQALRDAISRCIFGVDSNPMAVELCKINLWLESIEPGKPLSFLDHHLQCGNSLLGATPALLKLGIPDEAFTVIEGDDKKVCTESKKLNRDERARQMKLFDYAGAKPWERMGNFAVSLANLETTTDDSFEAIRSKEERYAHLVGSADYLSGRFWADTWCAAFVWKKTKDFDYAITEDVFRRIERNPHDCTPWMRSEIQRLAQQYRFFHWHLAFPQVFHVPTEDEDPENEQMGWCGGFDLVLGNPPWERISPDSQEFFGEYEPQIRSLPVNEQGLKIARLLEEPDIASKWLEYCRQLYATVLFLKCSGRYSLFASGNLGKGDFDVYRIFVELSLRHTCNGGFAAMIAPGGLCGGANSSEIRRHMLDACQLRTFLGLSNTKRAWFQHVDIDRFSAFVTRHGGRTQSFNVRFGLNNEADLATPPLQVAADLIRQLSPDAYAIPELRTKDEISVIEKMYSACPQFGREIENTPNCRYHTELHMTSDSHLFTSNSAGLPVYEGRMVDHFDHRAKSYVSGHGTNAKWERYSFTDPQKRISPQWYVLPEHIPKKLTQIAKTYRIGFCHVANPRSARSFVSTLIPPDVVCGNGVQTFSFSDDYTWAYLPWLAVANSLVMDSLARRKLSSPNMTHTVLDSLPFPRYSRVDPFMLAVAPVVLALCCTSSEMTPYWNEMASLGIVDETPSGQVPQIALVEESARTAAKCIIDAIVARHVFGFSRRELEDALGMFPQLERRELSSFGEFRTKDGVLSAYDRLDSGIENVCHFVLRQNGPAEVHSPHHASNTTGASLCVPPSDLSAPAAWQLTRGQYQDDCKAQGRTDLAENNRTYWREVESAIQAGKPVPATVLADFNQVKTER